MAFRPNPAAPSSSTPVTYAPRPDVSALATGLRVDPNDGNRVELEPAIGSFPTIADLLTTVPSNVAYDNVAGFSALAVASGQVTTTITGTGDYNSSVHTSPTLTRFMLYNGGAFRLTAHVSGTMPSTNSQGVGIGIWDGITNSKTCRMAVYYTGSAVKWYSGYGVTETSGALGGGAADVTTGIWLEISGDREGTITTQYQVAAYNTGVAPTLRRPSSSWSVAQTASRFFRDASGGTQWAGLRYGFHGIKTAGSNFSGLTLNHFDDLTMSPSGTRTIAEGVGIGFASGSPEITLVNALPVDWTVCTQSALRTALGVVATQRAWETGSVQFQIDGGSWVAASSATVGSAATTTIKARLVNGTGLLPCSVDVAAISALRMT
jgi:hypothetical protein